MVSLADCNPVTSRIACSSGATCPLDHPLPVGIPLPVPALKPPRVPAILIPHQAKPEYQMNPREQTRILLTILLLACLIPVLPAYIVSGMTINPPGNQPAGTPMTVSFSIGFPRGTSNVTFPQANELRLSTALAGARWTPVMVLDGMTTRMDSTAGNASSISGWYLSYPSYQDLELRMTLTGTIPENPSVSQDLVKVEEADAGGYIKSSARVALPEAPFMALTPVPGSTVQAGAAAAETTATKKPVVRKTFTPIPTETTAQESPLGAGTGIIAAAGAAVLFATKRG